MTKRHGFPDHIDSKGRGHWIERGPPPLPCNRPDLCEDWRESCERALYCVLQPSGRKKPSFRIRAWRSPNEDGAPVYIVARRLAAQYPRHVDLSLGFDLREFMDGLL